MRGMSRGTWALIAASAAAFAVDALSGHRLLVWGAKSPAIWAGEWHRLLAPNFIHSGVVHLAFDMYALYLFGRLVEELAGTVRFLFVYFFSGCLGFLASLWAYPESLSVGASAAVFGLMGYAVHYRLRRLPWRWLPIDASFAQILALNLILGWSVPSIDQFAHFGGLAGGVLAASIAGLPQNGAAAPRARRRILLDWLERPLAGALAAALLWAGLSPLAAAARVEEYAPGVERWVRDRYGKYFTPYVVTSPGLYWLDPSTPGAEWAPVRGPIVRPAGRPVALGLFWRWTEGTRGEEVMHYAVTWERRVNGEWSEVFVERGRVSRPDPEGDAIYRRSLLVDEGSLAGRWRVRVEGAGVVHFEREFVIVEE